MRRFLFGTTSDPALLVLRLALAIVIWPHGAQKLLGWFGGYGPAGSADFLQQATGAPVWLAYFEELVEFFAPILLVIGFLGRLDALGILVIMLVAVYSVHLPNGFFMNWSGKQPGEGFEYHILAIGISLALLIGGSGAWSVDGAIARKRRPGFG